VSLTSGCTARERFWSGPEPLSLQGHLSYIWLMASPQPAAVLAPAQPNIPLSVQIAGQLRARIASGDWAVGTRIPSEHELTEVLGTSRNTVREAVRGLVHAGLLHPRPGDGTYVTATSELEVAFGRRAGVERAGHVLEVREALEIHAARLAAARADDVAIAALGARLDERDAQDDVDAFREADLRFHRDVVAAAGNPLLLELYEGLDRRSTYPDDDGELSMGAGPGMPGEADPHRLLVAAIAAREPAAAQEVATRLIRHARQMLYRTAHQDRPRTAHEDRP